MKAIIKSIPTLLLISVLLICFAGCSHFRFGEKQSTQPSATAVSETAMSETAALTEAVTVTEKASTPESTTSSETETASTDDPTAPSTTAAPAISFPLVNKSNGFTLTLKADGTFTHEGVYNMDLSSLGIKTPLPIEIKTTGYYLASDGSIKLSNTKMIMNCSDETANSLSGFAKLAAQAIKNTELTDKSTAVINGGQLVISFVGNNGSEDFALSTHTFSADQTSAL